MTVPSRSLARTALLLRSAGAVVVMVAIVAVVLGLTGRPAAAAAALDLAVPLGGAALLLAALAFIRSRRARRKQDPS